MAAAVRFLSNVALRAKVWRPTLCFRDRYVLIAACFVKELPSLVLH
jgi:hypothetical protein